jgi:hypothetical protein
MVTVGTGKSGTRFIKTDWPITEGLIAGTTKLPEKSHLEAEEKDLTPEKDRVGL